MALCGCFPSCSCQLTVDPPELLTLSGNGDPLSGGWILTALETIFSATNVDGGVSITPGGAYGHSPQIDLITSDTDSVDLNVSAGPGLEANVRIDPASPTPISITNDGLYIPLIPSSSGDVPTGSIIDFLGSVAPAGYVLAYGQLVPIASYPNLFAAIGHVGSGGVDPGGGQFTIPDLRGRVTVGLDDMGGVDAGRLSAANTLGGTGGTESAQLAVLNLPGHTHDEVGSHNHPVSDSGHAHVASSASAGLHSHTPNSASRSFVTADSATLTQVDVNDTSPSNVTRYVAFSSGGATTVALQLGVSHSMVVSGSGADFDTAGEQLNNANTSPDGTHTHAITVDSATTGVTVGQNTDPVQVGGGGNDSVLGNAFLIMQPYMLVNKIIKD